MAVMATVAGIAARAHSERTIWRSVAVRVRTGVWRRMDVDGVY